MVKVKKEKQNTEGESETKAMNVSPVGIKKKNKLAAKSKPVEKPTIKDEGKVNKGSKSFARRQRKKKLTLVLKQKGIIGKETPAKNKKTPPKNTKSSAKTKKPPAVKNVKATGSASLNKLFIGNLPKSLDVAGLKSTLAGAGLSNIESVIPRVQKKNITCIVILKSGESAKAALKEFKPTEVGKLVYAREFFEKESAVEKGNKSPKPAEESDSGEEEASGEEDNEDEVESDEDEDNKIDEDDNSDESDKTDEEMEVETNGDMPTASPSKTKTKVIVTNIGESTTSDQLEDLLKKKGLKVTEVEIVKKANKIFGVATFDNEADQEKALKMSNKIPFGGKQLGLFKFREGGARPAQVRKGAQPRTPNRNRGKGTKSPQALKNKTPKKSPAKGRKSIGKK